MWGTDQGWALGPQKQLSPGPCPKLALDKGPSHKWLTSPSCRSPKGGTIASPLSFSRGFMEEGTLELDPEG